MDRTKFSESVSLRNVRITGGFWREKIELVRKEVLPYQYAAISDTLPDAFPSYCLHNFRAAAKIKEAVTKRKDTAAKEEEHSQATAADRDPSIFVRWPESSEQAKDDCFYGFAFQDTDAYKWIEAASYSLIQRSDAQLEAKVDEVVDLICSAQMEDGYLDTFYILTDPAKRFTDLKNFHELYCFGHLAEAACAYLEASGKDTLLTAACRYADCIMERIGPEEGKLKGVPGHEIAEMALVRLYEATGDQRYFDLGRYFIDERGKRPNYFLQEARRTDDAASELDSFDEETGRRMPFSYQQAHKKVREQEEAVGHAVRAVYLYSGMADYARLDEDESLQKACEKLWGSIVNKKMYVTGGIGGTHIGEAFSFAYDLPNDTAYAETCASVGMVFFARRMLQIDPASHFADVSELELYNGILPGIALDGRSFFYVNPLEVWPSACHLDARKEHVYPLRRKWLPCACCPPNLARLVSSVGAYAVTENADTIFFHQYMNLEMQKAAGDGELVVNMSSAFPFAGEVRVSVEGKRGRPVTLAFRLPSWCENPILPDFADDKEVWQEEGYYYVRGSWKEETFSFAFPMEVQLLEADSRVREDEGKAAVRFGPLIYCLEEVDNGPQLHLLKLPGDAVFETEDIEICGQKMTGLKTMGLRRIPEERAPEGQQSSLAGNESSLYYTYKKPVYEQQELHFVPYFAWGNRGENEMSVWVNIG